MKTDSVPSGSTLRNAVGVFKPQLIVARKRYAWTFWLGPYDFSDEKLRDVLGILPLKSAA